MHRFVNDGEFEHSEEHHSTAAVMAAVEAEHELVEVVRKVSPVHGALVGTQQPSLGQRSDPVYPGRSAAESSPPTRAALWLRGWWMYPSWSSPQ